MPDPQTVAAAATIAAQTIGGGLDWEKVWQLVTALATGGIAYLAATYKARHDAKLLQGSELSKQTERLVGGWEAMTDRAQQVIARQQAEMMAATALAMELQRKLGEKQSELDDTRRRYQDALRELEDLRGAARKKRSPTRGD